MDNKIVQLLAKHTGSMAARASALATDARSAEDDLIALLHAAQVSQPTVNMKPEPATQPVVIVKEPTLVTPPAEPVLVPSTPAPAPKPVVVQTHPDAIKADSPFGLFPEILETDNIAGAFSSWFNLWGGIIGAGHSVEGWTENRTEWPEWTKPYSDSQVLLRPSGLDAVLFGGALPDVPPMKIHVGMRLRIRGYPAATTNPDHYEIRNGFALMDRPEEFRGGDAASWIMQFDDGSTLAIGGMSGGVVTAVMPDGSEVAVAILITQNGRADLDGDGDSDHSSDITELFDVWTAIKAQQLSGKAPSFNWMGTL